MHDRLMPSVVQELSAGEFNSVAQRFTDKIYHVQQALGEQWTDSLGDCEFQPRVTVDRLKKLESTGVIREQVLAQFLREVEQDFRGFSQEFIEKIGFTPTEYHGYVKRDGMPQDFSLFGTRYVSNEFEGMRHKETYSVLNMINKKERSGGVFDAWKHIEQLAAQAPIGSLIMMTSPSGQSGIFNAKGEEFIYADSRTYFFSVGEEHDDSDIKRTLFSCDVQSDFDHAEHKALLKQFGYDLSPDALPNDIVKAVALITPDMAGKKLSIQDGLAAMKSVRKLNARHEYIYKDRTFEALEVQLDSSKNFLFLDNKYHHLMNEFTNAVMYFGSGEVIQYDKIEQALVLLILEAFMQDSIKEEHYIPQQGFDDYRIKNDITYTQQTAGQSMILFGNIALIQNAQEGARKSSANCPPPDYTTNTSTSTSTSTSWVNGRAGFWMLLSSEFGSELNFRCPKCQQEIEGGNGITKCPNPECGYTKEDAARESGVSCV